jgi:hypothetical protein
MSEIIWEMRSIVSTPTPALSAPMRSIAVRNLQPRWQPLEQGNAASLVSKLDRLSRDVAFVAGLDGAAGAIHRRRTGARRRPRSCCT